MTPRRWTVRALIERHVTHVIDAPDGETAERIFRERLRLAPGEQAVVFTPREDHTR